MSDAMTPNDQWQPGTTVPRNGSIVFVQTIRGHFCLVAWVRGDTTLRNADGVPIIAARWRWPTPNELAEWHKAKSRSHG
jgi:hypothetical protein